ncbi:nucleoside 2-deoxyribosyltransferase [Bifidobacterium sp.]|jgi:nucleoside 2-deoxyribosyltransferase|uniref:nucleoside 2-deoxyribosyltransferase n=1 Tax=Bifidobacterium sp. TaxID=41200 RepID=UPI0025C1778E|nr:nucleoside 2-deoxyribosyltransferase [Bifidobacterium sp.]MCH4210006.1 nucleoside 2-deoxyribosyltransferase [Bifidobacterium sp.]MCI1225199.1 nucleoside 2-deoxyribosyltransferase [Bifidobacterium sp.]
MTAAAAPNPSAAEPEAQPKQPGIDTPCETTRARFDFYVAGPFFNDEEVHSMERLEAVLEVHGRKLFKPRFGEEENRVHDEDWPKLCFDKDIAGIRDSDAVIANLIDGDTGTMFEIGYAYSRGTPVYGYYEGLKPSDTINLMIAQSVREVFTGPDDLAHWLETGEHAQPGFRQF